VLPLTTRAVSDFERTADELYDPDDARRGYVELKDRRGHIQRAHLVTLSIGVSLSIPERRFTDPPEVIAAASEMKSVAKGQPGSYVAMDRRRADGHRGLDARTAAARRSGQLVEPPTPPPDPGRPM
jgi:hypothetical protein